MKSKVKRILAVSLTLMMLFSCVAAFSLSVGAAAVNEAIDVTGVDTIGAADPTEVVSKAVDKKGGLDPLVIILIIAGAVVLIAAAGIIAYIVLKRKRDENGKLVAPQNDAPAARPLNYGATSVPNAAKGVARSSSAQHIGKAFYISDKPITIGRDASACMIAFEPGTPGVSSKHCTLGYNGILEQFVLTDVGSSFGTFLSDGTKLQPNVPVTLKAGDSFFVGDKANVIKLDVEK